jgi:hypothetical protein
MKHSTSFHTINADTQKHEPWRLRHPRHYQRRVRAAIRIDMAMPQRAPSFYALALHSHWRQRLFP